MKTKTYKATFFGYLVLSVPYFVLGTAVAVRRGYNSNDYIAAAACLIVGLSFFYGCMDFAYA